MLTLLATLTVTFTAIFLASTAYCATIANTKHDFRTITGSIGICEYCHRAHNNQLYAALWTKDPSVFRLYSAVDASSRTFKTGLTPDSKSLICMACHDGSTIGTPPHQINIPAGNTNFGSDLRRSHPINFQVTLTDTQKDLWVDGAAYTGSQMGRPDQKPYPLYFISGSGDRSGPRALECASCHDIHNSNFSPFLRETMDRSKLCFGCHNK